MKLAFALAVLFCLCYGAPVSLARHDMNLNIQMIDTMKELEPIVSFPSGFMLHQPGNKMIKNASNCVIKFTRELERVLENVIVPEDSKNRIDRLKANLKELEAAQGKAPNTNVKCTVVNKGNNDLPFHQYILFLRKLNSSSKK